MDIHRILNDSDLELTLGISDCEQKFGWPGLTYLLQAAFLRVEGIRVWPDTQSAIEKEEIVEYFRDLALSLIQLDN